VTRRDTSNLERWKERNTWYGVDAELTSAAKQIDAQIREAGVITVGSDAYFSAIDRQMRSKFPNRLSGSPSHSSGDSSHEAAGDPKGSTRIPEHIITAWKRMGLKTDTPEDIQNILKHRQKAVDKGILTEKMTTDRVITR